MKQRLCFSLCASVFFCMHPLYDVRYCVNVTVSVTSWVYLRQVSEDTVVGSLALDQVSCLNRHSTYKVLFWRVFLKTTHTELLY